MEIRIGVKLSKEEVLNLLAYFDDSSDIPLHEGLNFNTYSEKLSQNAYFVLAIENDKQLGFIAYYLNEEKRYLYIPQIVVHKLGRHKGIGHLMLSELFTLYKKKFLEIRLEVLTINNNARKFYQREGFRELQFNKQRILLAKEL